MIKDYRYVCPNCGHESELSLKNVRNLLISRQGAKEKRGYFVTCLGCKVDREIMYLDIPQEVRLAINYR